MERVRGPGGANREPQGLLERVGLRGRAIRGAPPLGEHPQLLLPRRAEALQREPVQDRTGEPAPRERLHLLGRVDPPAADLMLRLGQGRVQRQHHRAAPQNPCELTARRGLEPVHVIHQQRAVLGQRERSIPCRPEPARAQA